MRAIPTDRTTHRASDASDLGVNGLPVEVLRRTTDGKQMARSVWVPEERDLAVLRDSRDVGVLLTVYGDTIPELSVALIPLDRNPLVVATPAIAENLTSIVRLGLERDLHEHKRTQH